MAAFTTAPTPAGVEQTPLSLCVSRSRALFLSLSLSISSFLSLNLLLYIARSLSLLLSLYISDSFSLLSLNLSIALAQSVSRSQGSGDLYKAYKMVHYVFEREMLSILDWVPTLNPQRESSSSREFLIDNLLFRIHIII